MVKVFFDQVLAIVFAQNFNFAAEIVVWAPDQLILANVSMLLDVLAQNSRAALVVTFDNLEQTALIVSLQVFEHDDRGAFVVGADDTAEGAAHPVVIHVFATHNRATTIFEKALALVGAAAYLFRAVHTKMFVHLAAFNDTPTGIVTLKFGLRTVITDVLIHLIEYKTHSTMEEACDLAVHTFILRVLLDVSADYLSANVVIWTFDDSILTAIHMAL